MNDKQHLLHVSLGERSYDIELGCGVLPSLADFVTARTPASHAIVITDSNVEQPYGNSAAESLGSADIKCDLLVVEAGEPSKSIDTANDLWNKLLDLGADRASVVVAVGGGVIGDLAGFVAATYARGLPFVQVPTTLLAQVDSSVGGKVGVNLPGAKNMVGAFWQPRGVLIDLAALETLPDREYRAGLAEVVKYGVILDPALFQYLEAYSERINAREPSTLEHVVARCCRLKAGVVEQDEFEHSGQRAVLNYGHTFAHALEAVTEYGSFLHGEAVAIGMMCAARLAERLGRIDSQLALRQENLLTALGLPISTSAASPDDLLAAMARDKKGQHGRLRFVLPDRLGHVELVDDVPAEQIRAAIEDS